MPSLALLDSPTVRIVTESHYQQRIPMPLTYRQWEHRQPLRFPDRPIVPTRDAHFED